MRQLRPDLAGRIGEIDVDVQARVRAGAGSYQPLRDVGGLPCWPHEPDWQQLDGGEALAERGAKFEDHWDPTPPAERRTLRVGDDFDEVILGISIGALRELCAPLASEQPRWRAMVDGLATVPTQAVQLWLNRDSESLGADPRGTVLAGYALPLDTWADFSHTLDLEQWPPDLGVAHVSYFTSVLHGRYAPAEAAVGTERTAYAADLQVRGHAEELLREKIAPLLPGAVSPSRAPEFDWDLLVDPEGRRGSARLGAHYFRASVSPSDRYSQARPGTTKLRMAPDDAGYSNLSLAGAWVRNGLNAGTVESACVGGRRAAQAVRDRVEAAREG